MFKPVPSQYNPVLYEEQILNFWKLRRLFAKSAGLNEGSAEFVLYENPPSANRRPDVLDQIGRAYKDVFPRYKGMRGYHVTRRGGWHTQGLPVEIAMEKKLSISSKTQIEAAGIDHFNDHCRKSAFAFIQEWERFHDRIAYWGDMQNAFVSHTNEYMESIWWIFKTFWDRELIYQGYKVLPYCPRCGTPLSDQEILLDESDNRRLSAYVRMPLVDEPGTSLLVWTAAPWTLTGNIAVAAHPEVEYATVRRGLPEGGSEKLILARQALERVFAGQPVAVIETFKGRKLKGKRYRPLFTFLLGGKQAYRVILRDTISSPDGTGLASITPAFSPEDLQTAMENDLPFQMTVADDGTFISEIRPWSGLPVREAEPHIIQDLQVRGLLLGTEIRMQPSPTCMHCHAPLISLSRSTWFLRTSAFDDRLLKLNQQVSRTPPNAKTDRVGCELEKRFDWAIARERYWGTPLPVWECQACHHQLAAGSVAELSKLSKRDLSEMDLHRPFIDEVHISCPQCSGVMKRFSEVLDFWFDAGGMPVAQWHFPFADRAAFREQFPADLVCEPAEEACGWFYALHTISALLFDSAAFKNAISLGPALDANGQKLTRSISKGLDPWEVLNSHGSDAFRWYLYSTGSPTLEHHVTEELIGTALNSFILPLWDIYSFLVSQANLDRWSPGSRSREVTGSDHKTDSQPEKGPGSELIALDHWLRAELHTLVRDVAISLEAYDATSAACLIQSFLSDTLWYQRQTRRRFWVKEPTSEKELSYTVIYEVLEALSRLLAPLMPFFAEVLYQNLVRSQDPLAPESVHLCAWPGHAPEAIDENCHQEIRRVMQFASLGYTARSQAGIKAHQPLREIAFASASEGDRNTIEQFASLLASELNVKQVRWLDSPEEALSFTLRPLANPLEQKYPGIYPDLCREILELDPITSVSLLAKGEPLIVEVAGQQLLVLPDEVEIVRTPHQGLAVAFEGTSLASLDLEITPALKQEGIAGEFIGRILDLRGQAGLENLEWIQIYLSSTPGLWRAIQDNQELVLGETRAAGLSQGQVPEDAIKEEAWFDGEWMKAGIQRQELASPEAGTAAG